MSDSQMDIDTICDNLTNVNINVNEYVNLKLFNDLNLLIHEITEKNSFDVDIYDICISCGNELSSECEYEYEYVLCKDDIIWLKTVGSKYFFETLNSKMPIETMVDYNKLIKTYSDLVELFSLQINLN